MAPESSWTLKKLFCWREIFLSITWRLFFSITWRLINFCKYPTPKVPLLLAKHRARPKTNRLLLLSWQTPFFLDFLQKIAIISTNFFYIKFNLRSNLPAFFINSLNTDWVLISSVIPALLSTSKFIRLFLIWFTFVYLSGEYGRLHRWVYMMTNTLLPTGWSFGNNALIKGPRSSNSPNPKCISFNFVFVFVCVGECTWLILVAEQWTVE